MFPSELYILIAIDRHGRLNDYMMNSADVLSEYITIVFNSLRTRGYISGNALLGFRLTNKGKAHIAKHTVYRIKQKGDKKKSNLFINTS